MAYEMSLGEVCGGCGHRKDDWQDEKGELYYPPLFEATPHTCELCATKTRMRLAIEAQARDAAGTGDDAQRKAAAALAGVSVVLVPFDPDRE